MIQTKESFISTKNTINRPNPPIFPSNEKSSEKQPEPWPGRKMHYALMKTLNGIFEEWLRKNSGGRALQDHFEPRQPCKICKHINIDESEYPCSECRHNPHI
jgi:hypothetical protein